MNRFIYTQILSLFFVALASLTASDIYAANGGKTMVTPPMFMDPVPNDTTVSCPQAIPDAPILRATDDNDPMFMPFKEITAVDSPTKDMITCAGGTITRTWTATDMDNMTTVVTQIITISPDNTPPMVLIPEVKDTVSCDMADYPLWISSLRFTLASNTEECTGVPPMITDDAPMSFDENCGTATVTFTLEDACGNATTWVATYTIEDKEGPVINGLPANQQLVNDIITINDTLSCTEAIPPVPTVTVEDNCTPNLVAAFTENSGQTMDGTCSQYNYVIVRTWTVSDSCGNTTIARWRILVQDREAPSFTDPADLTITCTDDPTDLMITGSISNVMDNCGIVFDTSYTDMRMDSICPNGYTIQRIWRVSDVCGNTATQVQTIEIVDNEIPTFTPPRDTTINCDQSTSPLVTGQPTMVMDNCDPTPEVTSEDVVQAGSCDNTYTIRRTWRITDDCGREATHVQIINVVDTIAPVFNTQAQDLDLVCDDNLDVITAFNDWISMRGGADAADNCTDVGNLTWTIVEAGTNNPATLPAIICPAPDSIIRLLTVDFIVEDECGNRDTSTASFRVIDDLPPMLSDCPQDTTIATDLGECTAMFTLQPPVIEEECAASLNTEDVTANATLTSNAMPGQEGDVPVDPVTLNFNLTTSPPINAFGSATLTIDLSNADAEEATEYFRILGEDGTLLGQTELADMPCGSSTTILALTATQINAWAVDGVISIRLEPNIPSGQPGRFAVNAICNPASTVDGRLQFQTKNFTGLTYEYSINNGARVLVDPIAPQSVMLQTGENVIKYYATDCAGLVDSCAYSVVVEDQEPPVLICPDDIVVSLADDTCIAPIKLPLPAGATDNCGVGPAFQITLPNNLANAYLTFTRDPNLNTYLADDRTITFNNVAANATSDVTFTIDLLGDFNSNGAFFNVIGDDGSMLGTTTVGLSDCITPGQQVFVVDDALFNAWAVDGVVQITLEANDIPVPPGVAGDGINPCDVSKVSFDGDIDSTSFALVTLNYNQLTPQFYTEGATIYPLTQMSPPEITPTLDFNVGETEVFYIISDQSGNQDTCSYTITVEDNQAPMAVCQPTTIFINPSGLEIETVPASVIDAGSFDNCGIDTMFLTPNTFNCTQTGMNATVTLTVIDFAGNSSTCNALVRIESEEPQPTATTGLCGGDTLFLFANPPAATGGIVYTYKWTGPNGFSSTLRNPTILNVNAVNAGTYSVEVTGLTGCKSVGTVQVAIEDLPLTPAILTKRNVCVNEDIELTSSIAPSGTVVTYRWYRGTLPGGTLIGTTNVPSFIIPQPHSPSTNNYYLTVEADGCLSAPSAAVSVTANSIPTAVVNDDEITVCEGESITLGTLVSGAGITYEWSGPNNYFSTNQFPPVITSATLSNGGVYRLTVFRNGCPSPPDFTVVTVRPKPGTPQITNNGPVCEGQNITLSTTTMGATTYHWIAPNLQEFLTTTNSFAINNITKPQEGPWRLYVTQGGCNSNLSASTQVVVNTVPATVASANPNEVCEGNALQLFASPMLSNATYRWTGPNNFMAATPNPTINNVTPNRAGTYEVTITTLEGCSNKATVGVDVLPGVRIAAVSNDGQECLTGPMDVRLRATVLPVDDGTYQFRWTGPNFSSSDSIAVIPNATNVNNGNYQLVVTNSEGCASQPATTIVDVSLPPATPAVPTISPSTPAPFCEGKPVTLVATAYNGNEVTYSWNTPKGTVLTDVPVLTLANPTTLDNGLYAVTVIVDGCTSKASGAIGLTINQAPQIDAQSNSPVCSGDAIILNTEVIPGATYAWSGPAGFSSSVVNPLISPANPILNSGFYKVSATVNGCVSRLDSVLVTVNTRPSIPTAANSGAVCISNDNAALRLSVPPSSAVPNAVYTWYNQFGTAVGATTGLSFDLTNFDDYGDGSFLFTVTATVNGCASALSAPTTVNMNIIPDDQAAAGVDQTVCEADEIRLNAQQPSVGGGLWSQIGGASTGVFIENPASPNSRITGLQGDSTYLFQWTLSNGACANYDTDTIQYSITPIEIPNAGNDTTVCATDRVILDGLLPISGEGRWSQPEAQQTLGVMIGEAQNPNTLITGLESGNLYEFTWTIVSGCGGLADKVFVLTSDTEPFAGEDVIVCNDNMATDLNAITPADGSFGRWSSPDEQIIFSNLTNPKATASNLADGENLLVWTIDESLCGEFSRDTVVVTYKMNPLAQDDEVIVPFGMERQFNVLENDRTPTETTVTVVTLPSNGDLKSLENGNFIYTPSINFVGFDEMTYEICSEGCQCSIGTVSFAVGENAQCDVPSIITPNGDGINDFFVIPCFLDGRNYPRNQVSIYNRWGDEVYHSPTPYANNWDGTFDGEDLPPGTYFYVINFGDGSASQSGFVMIQR